LDWGFNLNRAFKWGPGADEKLQVLHFTAGTAF